LNANAGGVLPVRSLISRIRVCARDYQSAFGDSPLDGAYSRDGRRCTVLADERLTAFLEVHAAIHRQLELE
jgi:hypothetical protein